MAEFNLTKVMSGYTGTVASNKIHENDTTLAKTMGLQWARVLGHFNINTVLKQLEVNSQILVYYGLHHEQKVIYSSPTTIHYVAGSSSFADSVIAYDSIINTFVWWDLRTMTEQYKPGMYIVALLSRGRLEHTYSVISVNGKEFSTGAAMEEIERLSDKVSVLQTSPRSLYLSYEGVSFDESSGTYTVNGIAGITPDQMKGIYQQTAVLINSFNLKDLFYGYSFVTNIIPARKTEFGVSTTLVMDADHTAAFLKSTARVIYIAQNEAARRAGKSWAYCFGSTSKLERVVGTIFLSPKTEPIDLLNIFQDSSVQSFRINRLAVNLNINTAPNVDRNSILWLINNSTNTAPLNVTIHSETLARLNEEDIALASSRNITLTA